MMQSIRRTQTIRNLQETQTTQAGQAARRHGGRLFLILILFLLMLFTACTALRASADSAVHTLYWKATLRTDVKAGGAKIKKGTSVVVIRRSYNKRKKSTVRYKDKTFRVSNGSLSFGKDLTTIKAQGDYSTQTKEAFINSRKKASSKTSWLIWVSLDKQRVNIFRGAKGQWRLTQVYACSSGKSQTPTPTGWFTIDSKSPNFRGCKYYTEVCGSGIHKWVGAMNKKILGRHTASKGCIRLTEKNAKWVYKHVPRKTKVLIY